MLETDATNLEKGLNSDDLDRNAEGGLFHEPFFCSVCGLGMSAIMQQNG